MRPHVLLAVQRDVKHEFAKQHFGRHAKTIPSAGAQRRFPRRLDDPVPFYDRRRRGAGAWAETGGVFAEGWGCTSGCS